MPQQVLKTLPILCYMQAPDAQLHYFIASGALLPPSLPVGKCPLPAASVEPSAHSSRGGVAILLETWHISVAMQEDETHRAVRDGRALPPHAVGIDPCSWLSDTSSRDRAPKRPADPHVAGSDPSSWLPSTSRFCSAPKPPPSPHVGGRLPV